MHIAGKTAWPQMTLHLILNFPDTRLDQQLLSLHEPHCIKQRMR